MELDPPTPIEDLDALRSARAIGMVAATLRQNRLDDTLNAIGPPGQWHCDPHAGTLNLRGRTFAAEMLGSFDGKAWLWAWANPFLRIPDEKTRISRGAREADERIGTAVLATPFVALGELGPHDIAPLVTGFGLADAYYVCRFPGSEIVYALVPGQLTPSWPLLYELQRAATDALAAGLANGARSLEHAAVQLGLPTERSRDSLIVRDGDEQLTAKLVDGELREITSTVTLR